MEVWSLQLRTIELGVKVPSPDLGLIVVHLQCLEKLRLYSVVGSDC